MVEDSKSSELVCVILPLVKIPTDQFIEMGPIRFWTPQDIDNNIEHDLIDDFKNYIDKKESQDITCISIIDSQLLLVLDDYQRYTLIRNAAHFLCFLSNVTDVGFKMMGINDLNPFMRMRIITQRLLKNPGNWGDKNWFSQTKNKQAEMSYWNRELVECFGKILSTKYMSFNPRWAKRVIRAVESFNYVFEGKDVENEFAYTSYYFIKPEDIIFLCIALEALLDLHFAAKERRETTVKFINAIMTIVDIQSQKLKEDLMLWLKDFYNTRSAIVHGDDIVNIEQHIIKGVQAFYIALMHQLQSHTCLKPHVLQPYEMEQCHARLWTEEEILNIIKDILSFKRKGDCIPEVVIQEMSFLIPFYHKVVNNAPKFFFSKKDEDKIRIKRLIVDILEKRSKCHKSIKELLEEKKISQMTEFIDDLKRSTGYTT